MLYQTTRATRGLGHNDLKGQPTFEPSFAPPSIQSIRPSRVLREHTAPPHQGKRTNDWHVRGCTSSEQTATRMHSRQCTTHGLDVTSKEHQRLQLAGTERFCWAGLRYAGGPLLRGSSGMFDSISRSLRNGYLVSGWLQSAVCRSSGELSTAA